MKKQKIKKEKDINLAKKTIDNPFLQKQKLIEKYNKKGFTNLESNFIVELELARQHLLLNDIKPSKIFRYR